MSIDTRSTEYRINKLEKEYGIIVKKHPEKRDKYKLKLVWGVVKYNISEALGLEEIYRICEKFFRKVTNEDTSEFKRRGFY